MQEPMMTAREVAEKLGVSADTVYRLKDKPGGLPAYRFGRTIRFKPQELQAFIDAGTVTPVEKREAQEKQRFQYTPGMKVVL